MPKRRTRIADAVCFRAGTAIHGNPETMTRDVVCSFDNLYKAMWKCRRNVMWKDSVAGFIKNGLVNCLKLQSELYSGRYSISPYTVFYIFEPKKRKIVSTRIRDRVFQRSLCDNYLTAEITRSFIYDNAACQIGKGTKFARDRLKCHLQRFYRKHGLNGYVLKLDISDYFGSTAHSVALNAVKKRVKDPWAVSEVKRIIDSFNHDDDPNVGMGLGSQVTQLIQLAVLDDIDHFIKERLRVKYYLRYMDDFILIHEDKAFLRECKEQIAARLAELGLKISKKKTQIFPVRQTIRFLGFSFRLTDSGKVIMRLDHKKISHERRKLRKLVERERRGLMTREAVDNCFQSWKAHAEQGDCYGLIQHMKIYLREVRNENSDNERAIS